MHKQPGGLFSALRELRSSISCVTSRVSFLFGNQVEQSV